jgi:hypothetical protein
MIWSKMNWYKKLTVKKHQHDMFLFCLFKNVYIEMPIVVAKMKKPKLENWYPHASI